MRKKESKKFNKTLVFTIVIMALFISVISIEIITVTLNNKNREDLLNSYMPNLKAYKYYSVDDSKFSEVEVLDETPIGEMCTEGCDLKVNHQDENYYYMIIFNDNTYKMNLIRDNHVIVSSINLGESIDDAYFKIYKDYIVLYNKIISDDYEYDYALVSDSDSNIDEFTSLNSNEMEFTNDGIIYYYDVCANEKDNESHKIKAIRKPFNISPKAISSETVELSWC